MVDAERPPSGEAGRSGLALEAVQRVAKAMKATSRAKPTEAMQSRARAVRSLYIRIRIDGLGFLHAPVPCNASRDCTRKSLQTLGECMRAVGS